MSFAGIGMVLLDKFENECRSSGKNLHAKIYGVSITNEAKKISMTAITVFRLAK
jgi:hypothetical protein